jgi:hypothetical protein
MQDLSFGVAHGRYLVSSTDKLYQVNEIKGRRQLENWRLQGGLF